ncbi:MAG: hypothetical protein Q7V05_10080 [Methanoregula sp.]|nr:hypothetical protein [Methanoregula sp.]
MTAVPEGFIGATVCLRVSVVLGYAGESDCEGLDVVDVCVVAGDGALHPDNKIKQIIKNAKIHSGVPYL